MQILPEVYVEYFILARQFSSSSGLTSPSGAKEKQSKRRNLQHKIEAAYQC